MLEALQADGPEQQTGETAVAARADDKFARLSGGVEEHFGGSAVDGTEFDVDAFQLGCVRLDHCPETLERALAVLSQFGLVRDGRYATEDLYGRVPGEDCMKPSVAKPCFLGRPPERV